MDPEGLGCVWTGWWAGPRRGKRRYVWNNKWSNTMIFLNTVFQKFMPVHSNADQSSLFPRPHKALDSLGPKWYGA